MLYSETRKFVFVAVPKTGTTAIQKRLRQIDPELHRNHVHNEAGELVHVPTHATAAEIRSIMGAAAQGFTFVAFLRDPREVVLSKYHFYRAGRAARKQGLAGGSVEERQFHFGRALRVLGAQVLPLLLWARLYPYRSSTHFVTDSAGNLIVDHIGLQERLQEDVTSIFSTFGYSLEDLALGVANKTDYARSIESDLAAVVARRLPEDCALYDHLKKGASG